MILEVNERSFASQVIDAPTPVLVEFGASWCGPCIAMLPILTDVSDALDGRVAVAKVDVDESPSLAARYGIRNMPTMMLFRSGRPVDIVVGSGRSPTEMLKWLEKHAP